MGAPQADGLGNAKASEPHSGLGPTGAIPSALDTRLFANFRDGTLANAVELLAQEAGDPVARSCLYEAADKIRLGSVMYGLLATHPEYAADTTFAAIWQWLAKKDAALAKARGDA